MADSKNCPAVAFPADAGDHGLIFRCALAAGHSGRHRSSDGEAEWDTPAIGYFEGPPAPLNFCLACGSTVCTEHCIWCWTDCTLPDPNHQPYCPLATGMIPAPAGMRCSRCSHPVGDLYVSRFTEDGSVAHALCLPCATAL